MIGLARPLCARSLSRLLLFEHINTGLVETRLELECFTSGRASHRSLVHNRWEHDIQLGVKEPRRDGAGDAKDRPSCRTGSSRRKEVGTSLAASACSSFRCVKV